MTHRVDIAIFLPSLFGGGAERMMLNIATGCAKRNRSVDLVLARATGPYLEAVPPNVRLIDLGSRRVTTALPALVRYLRRAHPKALLSTLNSANAVAVVAKHAAGGTSRTVVRQASMLVRQGRADRKVARRLTVSLARWTYPRADAVVAVSDGVARHLATTIGLPRHRIEVVPNPVVTPEVFQLAKAVPPHPWFANGGEPVILGVGRLIPEKDFVTLVHAFALVRRQYAARLVILGEGRERGAIETAVRRLGVESSVMLPGFVTNPFAFMARAPVFVLSSAWEGLPGALIQAMACGAAVVATDCDSGPREILQNGRYGRLVPVGDASKMATAIIQALEKPGSLVPPEAWARYTEESAINAYLRVLGGETMC